MKKRKTHTFDEDLYQRFIAICDKNSIKASPWLNNKVKEFVEEEEKKVGGKIKTQKNIKGDV
jgi:hypothetical protein